MTRPAPWLCNAPAERSRTRTGQPAATRAIAAQHPPREPPTISTCGGGRLGCAGRSEGEVGDAVKAVVSSSRRGAGTCCPGAGAMDDSTGYPQVLRTVSEGLEAAHWGELGRRRTRRQRSVAQHGPPDRALAFRPPAAPSKAEQSIVEWIHKLPCRGLSPGCLKYEIIYKSRGLRHGLHVCGVRGRRTLVSVQGVRQDRSGEAGGRALSYVLACAIAQQQITYLLRWFALAGQGGLCGGCLLR